MGSVLCGCLMLGAASARAASPEEIRAPPVSKEGREMDLAAQHFASGAKLYQANKFEAARVEFEAAYLLSHEPDLLHNLSLTAEQQGKPLDALRYAERYLEARRAELSERELDETEGRILRLRKRAAASEQATPPALSNPAERTPATPAATLAERPIATERHRPPAGSLALLGSGAALLLAGIGCGAGALVTQSAVHDPQGVYASDYDALVKRGQGLSTAAIALDVVGGVALAGGAVWAIVDRLRPRRVALLPIRSLDVARVD